MKGLDHQKFVEWLQYHRHEQLVELICNTAAIQGEVDKLLREDHAVIMAKLDAIDTTLATMLSRVEGFSGLASAMLPTAKLSEQALSILRQLVKSNSSFFFRIKRLGGYSLQLENGGQIHYEDLRFLDADLNKLVELQLVTLDYNRSGGEIYRITREAVGVVEAIDAIRTQREPQGIEAPPRR